MTEISVILTVYNTGKFLNKCLISIINQTFSNFELIIINDGSTDNSEQICKNYTEIDKRISLITTKNKGVSAARNEGLKKANSNWLCFIDSDDWLEINFLEELYNNAKKYNTDFIGCGNYYSTDYKKFLIDIISPNYLIFEKNHKEWLISDTMFPYFEKRINNIEIGSIRTVWAKLFKKSIIENFNIKFNEDLKIAEDALFCLNYFKNVEKFLFISSNLYNYRINEESANSKYRSDIVEINLQILNAFDLSLNDLPQNLIYKRSYMGLAYVCICKMLHAYYTNKMNKMSFIEKYSKLKINLNNYAYVNALNYKIDSNFNFKERLVLYAAKRKMILSLLLFGYLHRILK